MTNNKRSSRTMRFETMENRNMLSAVPFWHSNPTSLNKIYLDFDGHIVTDSQWTLPTQNTTGNGGNSIHAPIYNMPGDADYDGSGNALPFSDQELAYIEMAWQIIAEDFAPFNVDVTTEAPPLDYFTTGGLDGGKALRVLFTSRHDDVRLGGTGNNWVNSTNQISGIGAFDAWSVYGIDRPAWVFANGFDTVNWPHPETGGAWGPQQEYMGTIASHEIGHGLGLQHDGVNPFQASYTYYGFTNYYGGHTSGVTDAPTSWGPIMGGAELRNLTQWSKGEYSGARHDSGSPNTQDDLYILADAPGSLGYRSDDHGNLKTTGSATQLTVSNGLFSAAGIIGGSSSTSNGNDLDVFRFNAGSTATDIAIYVDPAWVGPNLDVQLKIYDADTFALVATVNPPDDINATYYFTGQGEYYLEIDGVGKGNPLADGYTDYGSLGHYTVRGAIGAPRVKNVTISGSGSTHAPFSFNGPNDTLDYDGSGIQLRTVPVGNADTISIQFSEDVDVATGDLTLRGLLFGVVPNVEDFEYDPQTFTATWEFDAVFTVDQFLISLSDDVEDEAGNQFDGEWTNPFRRTTTNSLVSKFPSGNGIAGGDFNFVFTILPGDANLSNGVTGTDYLVLQSNLGGPGRTFNQADFNGDGYTDSADNAIRLANYSLKLAALVYADFDGDHDVDGDDLVIWQDNAGTGDEHGEGDVDADSDVDGRDHLLWQRHVGLEIRWVM